MKIVAHILLIRLLQKLSAIIISRLLDNKTQHIVTKLTETFLSHKIKDNLTTIGEQHNQCNDLLYVDYQLWLSGICQTNKIEQTISRKEKRYSND